MLTANGVTLDMETRCVEVEGRIVELTETEAIILDCLMHMVGRFVRADDISREFGYRFADHTIEVHLSNMNNKLGDDGRRIIRTRPSFGFGFFGLDDFEPIDRVYLKSGQLRMYPVSKRVIVGEHEVELTSTQFVLLRCLLLRSGRCVSHDEIMEAMGCQSDHMVMVHVHNLRGKLKPFGFDQIRTIRQFGYLIPSELPTACRELTGEEWLDHIISVNGVVLDQDKKEATFEGRTIRLSRMEFVILEALMLHAGRVYSREALLAVMYPNPLDREYCELHNVEVHIANTRRRLKAAGADGLIVTKLGFGYKFLK